MSKQDQFYGTSQDALIGGAPQYQYQQPGFAPPNQPPPQNYYQQQPYQQQPYPQQPYPQQPPFQQSPYQHQQQFGAPPYGSPNINNNGGKPPVPPSNPPQFATRRRFNDLWATILFGVFMAGFIVFAYLGVPNVITSFKTGVFQIPHANNTVSSNGSSTSTAGSVHLGISTTDILGLLGSSVGTGFGFSIIYFFLMLNFPGPLITFSYFFNVVLLLALAGYAFYAGVLVMAIIYLVFAVLTGFMYYWVRDRIPFSKLVLETVCKITARFNGTLFVAFGGVVLSAAYSILWLVTLLDEPPNPNATLNQMPPPPQLHLTTSSTKRILTRKLRNGIPSYTQPVSIKGLAKAANHSFEGRIVVAKDLDTTGFDYVVHPSTLATLSHSLDALLAAQIPLLPSVSSGLVVLSCPYGGADLYVRSLLEHYISSHPAPLLYLHVRPEDVFPRLSGHDVINFPPIVSPADSAEATTMTPASGSAGRKKTSSSGGSMSPASMFGNGAIVVEVGPNGVPKPISGGSGGFAKMPKIPGFSLGDSGGELEPDTPTVPYPWFTPYTTTQSSSQEPKSLLIPRIQSEFPRSDFHELIHKGFESFFSNVKDFNSQHGNLPIVIYFEDLLDLITPDASELDECELVNSFAFALQKCRDNGVPLVVVTGSTPTTRGKLVDPRKGSSSGSSNPLSSLVKAIKGASAGSSAEAGNSAGSTAKKQKPVKFYTKLDDYIGPVSVAVYPPVHLGAVALNVFQKRMKKDLRLQILNVNRREMDVVFKSYFDAVSDELDWKAWLDELLGDKAPRGRRAAFEEKVLSPGEVEELLLFAIGNSTRRQVSGSGLKKPINQRDLEGALDTFVGNAKTLGSIRAGAEFAGVFANPADHLTVTKYEAEILKTCLIKPSDLHVSFNNIGGLTKTKQVIEDLIQLPLRRPDLFSFGVLKQSTTGLLLFGPPGTGKTLLAKSIASSSGANFLNIQQSSIQSKWVGENEKNVKAIFSLARKLKPCVIFVDEIDALLKVRVRDQPHWVTNTINEWMLEWDGINSKGSDGIIVVGATNRPFDLDEAVLRRLPRRLFVNLPDGSERSSILDLILTDEKLAPNRTEVLEYIVAETNGFSGSDLKNLCIAAALGSVRRVLEEEKTTGVVSATRVLEKRDFENALESGDVVPSLSDKAELMKELVKWDKVYGIRAGGRKDFGGWGFDLGVKT
ncbi:UNVERIFIED_CONTAM: hypothetical protein HDU68_000060 [Siphonaria sp. JEL0065]|nr:hypothetical protein HDU68_000060 [Siphonaria sp. JEL0065]